VSDPPAETLGRSISPRRAKGRDRPLEVLAYWAKWGDDAGPWDSLQTALPHLDYFSPYWCRVEADGSLTWRESDRDTVAAEVRRAGVPLLLLVTKTTRSHAPLEEPAVRDRAVASVVQAVLDSDYAGVHLDFEMLTAEHRDLLTDFVRRVGEGLRPEGRLVTVAVCPQWPGYEERNPPAEAYDYEALGRLVDRLVVMTYDQHGRWSEPGPIASYPWVGQVVQWAVERVPPRKLMLGLAGYGYDWTGGGSVSVVRARDAVGLAARWGTGISWDAESQEAHFSYVDSGQARHEVWFENSFSITGKLALARRYGLGGVALWSLGQEDARLWDVLGESARPSQKAN